MGRYAEQRAMLHTLRTRETTGTSTMLGVLLPVDAVSERCGAQ